MMETINMSYPVFEPDQVLTSDHLNNLRRYLTAHDRITRSHLIGIGIVCGFEVSNPTTASILISKGVGITSKGFIISLGASLCKFYRPYVDKAFIESSCTSQTEGKYTSFLNDDGKQYNMWELLTTEEEADIDDNSIVALDKAPNSMVLDDMYLLLYLEIEDENLMACFGEDCDEKGINRHLRVRKLMVKKTDLLEIINKSGSFDDLSQEELEEELNAKYNLKEVSIKRLGYNYSSSTKTLSLQDYHYFSTLYNNYRSVILDGVPVISKALYQSYEAYKPLLANTYSSNPLKDYNSANPAQIPLYSKIFNHVNKNKYAVQYVYDFLKDLIDAYNEFRDVAYQMVVLCCPNSELFPRHLMIGKAFNGADDGPTIFRQYFIYSPILNNQKKQTEKARLLFIRIIKMINSFYDSLLELQEIKITPSLSNNIALSKRAIPFYYSVNDQSKLYQSWNYELRSRYRSRINLSYHAGEYNTEQDEKFVREPNWWKYDQYNFLRIEGHVGKKYETAIANIIAQTEQQNLPIKVIGLKLSKRFDNTNISVECKFEDLQNLYNTFSTGLKCSLLEEADFFRSLKTDVTVTPGTSAGITDNVKIDPGSTMETTSGILNLLRSGSVNLSKTEAASTTKESIPTSSQTKHYKSVSDTYKKSDSGTIGFLIDNVATEANATITDILLNAFAIGELGTITSSIFTYIFLYPIQVALKIEALSKNITDNLEDLDIEELASDADSLKETAEGFKTSIETNLANPDYQRVGNEEVILYRLDKLIYNCCISKIKELHEIYLERVAEVKKMNLFASFAEKHTGMEHLAGVHKGGTFIVVYIDKNELSPGQPGIKDTLTDMITRGISRVDNSIASIAGINYAKGTTANDKLKDISYRNLVISNKISDVLKSSNDVKSVKDGVSNVLKEELAVDTASINNLLNNIDELADELKPDYGINVGDVRPKDLPPDNIVVADFALPYLCCGDCPQIATMIVAQISISLPKTVFCGKDETTYPFTLAPKGGKVIGPGVTSQGADYFFTPVHAVDQAENIQFIYAVNNQTVVYNVKVYNPIAAFEIMDVIVLDDGSVQVQFANKSTGANKYLWDFGDGNSSTQSEPIYTYKSFEGSVAVVTLTASKGECEDLTAQDVEIPQKVEIEFNIEPKVFCKKDTSLTPFITIPEGGKVDGPGVVSQDTKYFFKPSAEKVEEGINKFTYTAPNGQQATLSVEVFNAVALFEYKVGEFDPEIGGVKVEFFNKSNGAKSFVWDFGDGITSDEENPVHEYIDFADPVAKVTLLASTGECTDAYETEIELPQGVTVVFDLAKRQFCNNDKQLYKFTTQPPATPDSPVTGTGVFEYNSEYYFRPIKLVERKYTLKYRDLTLDVEVFQAPVPNFNFDVENSAFGAVVHFFYTDDNIKSIRWDFGDGKISTEINPQHIYNVEVTTTFKVRAEIIGSNGCIAIAVKDVIVDPLVNIPGIVNRDDINRLATDRLSDTVFGTNNRLLSTTSNYYNRVEEEYSNPNIRLSYLSGEKNDEIATNTAKITSSTLNMVAEATGRDKKKKQNYLMLYFIVQLENLINMTMVQEGDIERRSKIEKVYLGLAEKLSALRAQDIDVDPQNSLRKLVEEAIGETANKPVLNKALKKIVGGLG